MNLVLGDLGGSAVSAVHCINGICLVNLDLACFIIGFSFSSFSHFLCFFLGEITRAQQ